MPCPSCLASRSPFTELWLQNLRGRRLSAMRSVALDSGTLRTSYFQPYRYTEPAGSTQSGTGDLSVSETTFPKTQKCGKSDLLPTALI